MNCYKSYRPLIVLFIVLLSLMGCSDEPAESGTSVSLTQAEPAQLPATSTPGPVTNTPSISPRPDLSVFAFPAAIDPAARYLLYIHGKIIEDQGLPAVSPEYGEYKYEAILRELAGHGFVVIGEQRGKDADGVAAARAIDRQVMALLTAGVPAANITIMGASKGAGITIFVSHFLANETLNYVLLAICQPDLIEDLIQDEIFLTGNVLSIYDSVDEYAGSCRDLFTFSEGKGIGAYEEIVLDIGAGHGILYQPLSDWIVPAVEWANNHAE